LSQIESREHYLPDQVEGLHQVASPSVESALRRNVWK
jgi:hypothetical protein